MPLSPDTQWTYEVRSGLYATVQEFTITEEIAVGERRGFRLDSPSGESRLSWDGNQLVASVLGGAQFNPPLPLLDTGQIPGSTSAPSIIAAQWQGTVRRQGQEVSGRASLEQARTREQLAGQPYDTVESTVTIQGEGFEPVEIRTWFVRGLGILRQQQRSGDSEQLDRSLQYLTGPVRLWSSD